MHANRDPRPTDAETARKQQLEQEWDRLQALRGPNDPAQLPAPRVLDAILSVAVAHDRVCQYARTNVEHGASRHLEDRVGDYRWAVVELCAILAPAALRHVPEPAYAKAIGFDGTIEGLAGDDLDEFMRPIFREAGIEHRFEVRDGFVVCPDAPAASVAA